MIKFSKRVPIYYGKLVIIVNDDFGESLSSLGLKTERDYNECQGLSYNISIKNRTHYIILLTIKPTHSIIAHEALHIAHGILKNIEAISDINNDETTCYLLDWIIEEIYKGLKKNNIEIII